MMFNEGDSVVIYERGSHGVISTVRRTKITRVTKTLVFTDGGSGKWSREDGNVVPRERGGYSPSPLLLRADDERVTRARVEMRLNRSRRKAMDMLQACDSQVTIGRVLGILKEDGGES